MATNPPASWQQAMAQFTVLLNSAANLASATECSTVFSDAPDEAIPGPLLQASDGTIYGLTSSGGNPPFGTVYKVDASGVYSIVHSFNGSTGASPVSLVEAPDGSFYGTTANPRR